MITNEHAQALAQTAAHNFLVKHGNVVVEDLSLIEYLLCIERTANAVFVAKEGHFVTPQERDQLLWRVAGMAHLALQHHGDRLYTTHMLQRNLHPQQANQKSLLLENQFVMDETKDAFVACREQAKGSESFNAEVWNKLRRGLQKFGVSV